MAKYQSFDVPNIAHLVSDRVASLRVEIKKIILMAIWFPS